MNTNDNRYDNANEIYSSSKKRKLSSQPQSPSGHPVRRVPVYKMPLKHKVVNVVVILFSLIFVSAGCMLVYAQGLLSSMFETDSAISINYSALPSTTSTSSMDVVDAEITDSQLIHDPMVLNIALFGSDVRPNETAAGNSDTIMLISIDNRHQKLKLTSFMRDTWVSIPEVNYNGKLNAAYSAGGPALAVKTLERNFGIDIDRYAVVDFETFPQVIDTLGGIDLTINDEEAAYLHYDWPYRTPSFSNGAGEYHLNGQEALDHARNRHVGFYDFERTQRQRDVMMAVVDKFKGTTDISTFINLMVQFLPSITTNISISEMSSLAQNSIKYIKYPISQFRLPTDDNYTNSSNDTWGSILVINNIKKAREDLTRFIYEEVADKIYGATNSQVPSVQNYSSSSVSVSSGYYGY